MSDVKKKKKKTDMADEMFTLAKKIYDKGIVVENAEIKLTLQLDNQIVGNIFSPYQRNIF